MKKYKHKIYVIRFWDIKYCSRRPTILRWKPNEKGKLRFLDELPNLNVIDDDLKIKVFNA